MLVPPFLDPMTILQNRWYNSLANALGHYPSSFQIIQPTPPIVANDEGLWACSNVFPPYSLTFNTVLTEADPFFDSYATVLSQLQYPESSFEQDIGAQNFINWKSYLLTLSSPPTVAQLPLVFYQWACIYAPDVASTGQADLTQDAYLFNAQQALQPYLAPEARSPDFLMSWNQLLALLNVSQGAKWTFDSSTEPPFPENTWTDGINIDFWGVYAGAGSNLALSQSFGESQIQASITINALAVLPVIPGAWYNSSIFNTAYSAHNSPPWKTDANPNWDATFGIDGNMRHFFNNLLIADGVNITLHSHADYTSDIQHQIAANASTGLWPFYAPTSAIISNKVSFDSSGMSIEIASQSGNPMLIGANVLGVNQYLGQ